MSTSVARTRPAPTQPRRHDITPAHIGGARRVLDYAQRVAQTRWALLEATGEDQWGDEDMFIVIHDAVWVLEDPQCRELAEQIVRRSQRAHVYLNLRYREADRHGEPGHRYLPLAAFGGSPTLHSAAQLDTLTIDVDDQPVPGSQAVR